VKFAAGALRTGRAQAVPSDVAASTANPDLQSCEKPPKLEIQLLTSLGLYAILHVNDPGNDNTRQSPGGGRNE
jgi:hypothetical protein